MSQVIIDTEKENKLILREYRSLLRSAKHLLNPEDIKEVRKAYRYSADAHDGMRRKSGEPYILHPIAVAQITVEEMGLDKVAIIAALLHDTVEDTGVTVEDIRQEFGGHVAKIVEGLTKIESVYRPGASQQAENFRKMLLTLSEDVRVILVKIADRLHNMRTLESMPRAKQLKISSETIYLYAALAHRLGLYSIKSELEDLWLKYTERDKYNEIEAKLEQSEAARKRLIKHFIRPIKKSLEEHGFEYEIKGRTKSIYSIWRKMEKNRIPFEEVYDLFAVRIILEDVPEEEEKAACWKTYSVVTDHYKPNPDRLRDWITTPKTNGYESLHTTVMNVDGQWVEVQIRTRRMDDIAEKGLAAHWRYKEGSTNKKKKKAEDMEQSFESWLVRVREMLEESDVEAIDFVNDFRKNLYSDEIFVFTPQGDLKSLPKGATALDFAFDIHTEVGSQCIGAKVNNKLAALSHELRNGDQVEILTSSKQKPGEHWLEWVKTSKAIAKIKSSLKEDYKRIAEEGRQKLERHLEKLGVDNSDEVLNKIRAFFNSKTVQEIYYKAGRKVISRTDLKKFKQQYEADQEAANKPEEVKDAKSFQKAIKKRRKQADDSLLIGEDMSNIHYTLAKCCNPIPGDDVFGFVTVNEGIRIHRTSCPNAIELMSNYGYRIIKAKWTQQEELAFLAGLKITGSDRVGLISDITKVLSEDLKVNMRTITVDSDDGIFDGTLMLFVRDTKHLGYIIETLEKVEGVEKIARLS